MGGTLGPEHAGPGGAAGGVRRKGWLFMTFFFFFSYSARRGEVRKIILIYDYECATKHFFPMLGGGGGVAAWRSGDEVVSVGQAVGMNDGRIAVLITD